MFRSHTTLTRGEGMTKNIKKHIGKKVKLTPKAKTHHRCPEGRENNRTAIIKGTIWEGYGGLVLDRDLAGCRYWNIEDVELVPTH